jgi:hypothetical protein
VLDGLTISAERIPHDDIARAVMLDLQQPSQMFKQSSPGRPVPRPHNRRV